MTHAPLPAIVEIVQNRSEEGVSQADAKARPGAYLLYCDPNFPQPAEPAIVGVAPNSSEDAL